MSTHWFLDLDGVRSGPYQTPEILSLIAEGEVLPHHLISVGLKGAEWITILNWRMDLSRQAPASTSPEISKEVNAAEEIPAAQTPIPPALNPQAKNQAREETPNPRPSESFSAREIPLISDVSNLEREGPSKTSFVHKEEVSQKAPAPKIPFTPSAPVQPATLDETPLENETTAAEAPAPNAKRDPMAEMFDVLQTTKQRREAKTQLQNQIQSQQSVAQAAARAEKSGEGMSSSAKTIGIGLAIVCVGFVLGQVFQNAAPPPAAPVAKTSPTATPGKAEDTVVVDRSTDKMTIRARVEKSGDKKVEVTKPKTQALVKTPKEVAKDSKEAEELKALKQELQELKNMKNYPLTGGDISKDPELPDYSGEEDESGMNPNNPDAAAGMIDPAYRYYGGQNPGVYPQGDTRGQKTNQIPQTDDPNAVYNPRGGAQQPNSNVHY